MTTIQELPAEVQARVESIVAKWKANHDNRGFDWLDVREWHWDKRAGDFRSFEAFPRWGKVQRGTEDYESNLPNHSEGWWQEIVGDDRPEETSDYAGHRHMQTFGEAIRDEVDRYLYEIAPSLWPTIEDDADEPSRSIFDILNSLPG